MDYYKTTEMFASYPELKQYLNKLFAEADIIELHIHCKKSSHKWYAEYRDSDCINHPFKVLMGIVPSPGII